MAGVVIGFGFCFDGLKELFLPSSFIFVSQHRYMWKP